MSNYDSSSWRDDYEFPVGAHPSVTHAVHALSTTPVWPFPLAPIPVDKRTPAPQHPDAEEALV